MIKYDLRSKALKYLSAFFTLLCVQLSAWTSADVFEKYLNPVFIETGSYTGDGIQLALKAGFEEVHSIEISPKYYNICVQRFGNNPKVHLYLGDSVEVLPRILSQIDRPATLWLDGHFSGGDTGKGMSNTPILAELGIIANCPINTHTILIDDIRQCSTKEFDYISLKEIIDLLLVINQNYHIKFEDGYIKDDVITAEIVQ